jgi:hypothetical protein
MDSHFLLVRTVATLTRRQIALEALLRGKGISTKLWANKFGITFVEYGRVGRASRRRELQARPMSNRRLSKDYEYLVQTAETFIDIAAKSPHA